MKKMLLIIVVLFCIPVLVAGCGEKADPNLHGIGEREYVSTYTMVGSAIESIDKSGLDIKKDADLDGWTDYFVGDAPTDPDGNELTPGKYEYQYIGSIIGLEAGSMYAYINDELRIICDPEDPSNSKGKVFEFSKGDKITISNANFLMFYKVK